MLGDSWDTQEIQETLWSVLIFLQSWCWIRQLINLLPWAMYSEYFSQKSHEISNSLTVVLFFVVKPHEVKLLEWVCFLQSQSLKKLEPITHEWEWAWWILIGEKDQRELMSVPVFHFHSAKIPILGHQAGVKGMSVIVMFFESCTCYQTVGTEKWPQNDLQLSFFTCENNLFALWAGGGDCKVIGSKSNNF